MPGEAVSHLLSTHRSASSLRPSSSSRSLVRTFFCVLDPPWKRPATVKPGATQASFRRHQAVPLTWSGSAVCLNRRPRAGARRIGCRQRHVQKAASGGFYASRTPRCCLGIIEAPFLTRTVAVGARTGPPPRTAGASEQPLWRAHEAATGACWRQERAAARAAVWVACVERAGPRPTAAVTCRHHMPCAD